MSKVLEKTPENPLTGLETWLRNLIRQEVQAAQGQNGHGESKLLKPEELAKHLQVPLSWVYEQSRQGNIPTHRLGRYLRFHLSEVLASQKKD